MTCTLVIGILQKRLKNACIGSQPFWFDCFSVLHLCSKSLLFHKFFCFKSLAWSTRKNQNKLPIEVNPQGFYFWFWSCGVPPLPHLSPTKVDFYPLSMISKWALWQCFLYCVMLNIWISDIAKIDFFFPILGLYCTYFKKKILSLEWQLKPSSSVSFLWSGNRFQGLMHLQISTLT